MPFPIEVRTLSPDPDKARALFPPLPEHLQDKGWDTIRFHVEHSEPVLDIDDPQ